MLLCAHWPTLAPDLPADLVRDALSVSGVFDLDPISRVSFLKSDLKLGPAEVKRLSPAGFPPPAGRLHAVAGALESSEFLRQNRLIRRRWGAARVPLCEAIPGRNHFTVIDMMAEPGSRLHRVAMNLLHQPATD
jgi:arylformamidase